ncbi:NAD(P)-dependent oxidoreductase [Lichenifustis flavocetrariae]|uniref:NAD(P)-dependent oxidoreductase n=1 Tax=Lichenifustis flavocetrariae TaxID=2949735 RepID=A0AA41Z4S9_9HYPH|nr:NAD(P)-dependent oxidoreductase [Lichenifustis flavocetrariae]MCW6509267.1 NAD(P)-dependent oxidoreductase [Lichenifustis flavocetrariae]
MQTSAEAGQTRIGWIGIGKMGSPMVRSVLSAGYAVTISEPLLENRASALAAGARLAETIADLAASSDVIITTVANDSVLHDIIFGAGGLAQQLRPPQVLIDLSTVSPRLSQDIADVLEPCGVEYLRAPVSGSTATAQSAQLTVIVSGPKPAWQRVEPLLACFSTKQFWVGERDEARYLKLAINVLVGGTSALLGEALAVGQCSGLPLATIMDVICESAVASPVLNYKREAILADDFDPSFSVAQMVKDLELIGEVADGAALPLQMTDTVRRRFEAARRNGLGDKDYFVLVRDHIIRPAEAPRRSTRGRAKT